VQLKSQNNFSFVLLDWVTNNPALYQIDVPALRKSALYQIDVPALSYIYAAYGKSGLISNGKE
jgi:hypothetical protein